MTQTTPLPDPSKPIEAQEITVLLACLLWGEARGCHDDGKLAVANVVKNRVLSGRFPGRDDWAKVITAPLQFSSLNANDPNRKKLLEPLKWDSQSTWDSCYACASAVLDGMTMDNTQRATHYFDRSLDANPPHWAAAFVHTCDIDRLHFYRDNSAYRMEPVPAGVDFDSHLTNG